MNRRGFLGALIGAAVLDPEKLLWVPGKKLISIPKPLAAPVLIRVAYTNWRVTRWMGSAEGELGRGSSPTTFFALASAWPRGREITEDDYPVPDPIGAVVWSPFHDARYYIPSGDQSPLFTLSA